MPLSHTGTPQIFVRQTLPNVPSIRFASSVRDMRMELPPALPPMAAGLFGYIGYDVVRLVERLGPAPPDPLHLPDAIMLRPAVTAIFDNVRDEIIIVAAVWPTPGHDAAAAYQQAADRLAKACRSLELTLARGAN